MAKFDKDDYQKAEGFVDRMLERARASPWSAVGVAVAIVALVVFGWYLGG